MKKSIFTLLAFLLFSVFLFAQSSQQTGSKPTVSRTSYNLEGKEVLKKPAASHGSVIPHATAVMIKSSNNPAPAAHSNVAVGTAVPKAAAVKPDQK